MKYLYKYGSHDCGVEKIFVHENALIIDGKTLIEIWDELE